MKRLLAFVTVLCMLFSFSAIAEESEDTYTYNAGQSVFPTMWDPMRHQTQQDGDLVSLLGNGLFTFDYNDDMDGYVIEPLAAADFPVDVTADYVGEEWGIEEGETGRAWKITIREDLMWEDGTPITADDFEQSAKLQLNPKAQNYRADNFYSGNMVVTGAEDYAKGGVESDTSINKYLDITDCATVEDLLASHGEEAAYINWGNSFGDTYDFTAQAWTGAAEDAVVETGLTLAELYDFYVYGAGGEFITWADEAGKKEFALDELFVKYTYPEKDWSEVGFKALDHYNYVIILEKPLEGFYLLYSMSDPQLVNPEMYEKCTTMENGVYNNTYGTTAETTISWGPYKLTQFQSDKVYTLDRNENWFGFNDEDKADQYQATTLRYDFVAEASTRLEMLLNGQLDVYGLSADDMDEYSASDYTYYDEGDSVFAITFNPDKGALAANEKAAGENINKTILTIKDFRIAMSLGLDRAAFCLATSPTNMPAFALYGSQIVADPDNGLFYRNTDAAKQVVVNFWGLADEIGEGKLYATIDDAIDSISGYNLEMARAYFDSAYDQAIEQGLMDEDDVVEIIIGTSNNTTPFYNSGYDFLVNNYTEAVKGTKLEGKLTFKRDATLGNAFSDALRTNKVDMLFGVGWTGSTFDPFSLMEAYTENSYQYDPSWDTTVEEMTLDINGEEITATVWDWTCAISGTEVKGTNAAGEEVTLAFPYSTDEAETAQRFEILAALENRVLTNYDFIPIMGDSSAKIKGMQIEYYTEDEVFPMSRGGIQYMTFNYSDAEWEAYVAEQGGTLNYK